MEVRGVAESRRRQRTGLRRRIFTLEHANCALPLVSRIVNDIVQQHKRVTALEAHCEVADPTLSGEAVQAQRDRYAAEIDKLRELARELTDIGVELKDWRRGLVDFLSLRQGREVYLCWRLGEERVEFWHDLEAGFPGRQPIDESFAP